MRDRKVKESIGNLERAIRRLEEAVAVETSNELAIDGTIQRFEFAFELLWKTLKRIFEFEGKELSSSLPGDVLKECFAQGWLHDETLWQEMRKSRNMTSHVYDEEMAKDIYAKIMIYTPAMRQLLEFLKSRYL